MEIMIEILGWIAGFTFAFCGAPQAYKSFKEGHSRGVSLGLIYMWLSGEILMQLYVLLKHGWDMPLLVNYWINTVFVIIIAKYKHYER